MKSIYGEPLVVEPGQGKNFPDSMEGKNNQYVKVGSEQTGGQFTLMEDNMQVGAFAPPHKHLWHDECFCVVKGTIHFTVAGKETKACAGTVVYVPRNTVHSLKVKDEDSTMLMIYTPGSFDITKEKFSKLTPEQLKDMDLMKKVFIEGDFFMVE